MYNVYGAVIMTQVIARVHPVHLTNADQRRRLPTLRPGQPTWAAIWPTYIIAVYYYSARKLKADTHFSRPCNG